MKDRESRFPGTVKGGGRPAFLQEICAVVFAKKFMNFIDLFAGGMICCVHRTEIEVQEVRGTYYVQ